MLLNVVDDFLNITFSMTPIIWYSYVGDLHIETECSEFSYQSNNTNFEKFKRELCSFLPIFIIRRRKFVKFLYSKITLMISMIQRHKIIKIRQLLTYQDIDKTFIKISTIILWFIMAICGKFQCNTRISLKVIYVNIFYGIHYSIYWQI